MSHTAGPLGQRIAAELRAELGRQNKSRRWLAEQVDQPHATVNRWVSGESRPDVDSLDALCRALGFTVSDLLTAVQSRESAGPHRRRATDYLTLVVA